MHTLGHQLRLEQGVGDRLSCLADVSDWEFYNHLQLYEYESPVVLDAGNTVHVTCDYNTLSRTDPIVEGDGFGDERCSAFLYATKVR